ncbi:MAG: hypothetical protein AB7T31_09780 [Gemmatimonadales bacterium]
MSEAIETIDEPFPHREIAEFLAEGLAGDDVVVIISTPERRRGLESHLARLGIELGDLERRGRASWCDSRRVLERILVDGLPDEAEFENVMKGILVDGFSMLPHQRVRTYHDLVDVLRDRGSLDAAVRVLRLWNRLCSEYEELLLAYTVAEIYREKDCTV